MFEHFSSSTDLEKVVKRPQAENSALQCTQNSVICDNGWTEIYALNVGVARWNPQILMAYPQSIALNP